MHVEWEALKEFAAKARYGAQCSTLALLAIFAALSLQGCLPPDWSFCDCDFRDNYWNHVLTDVHLLWNTEDFAAKARDNTTFHGKYLQGPLPEGYDCPEVADSFWKGWPRFGLTRGLIEGSMGDLWMPAARDRFKGICMAGHFGLLTICSAHFLVKAAKAIENGEDGTMRWLEAAYSHMVSIRNLGVPYQLRSCMEQQGWPMHAAELHGWATKWLGPESNTAPVAAYMGNRLDPYGMLYTGVMSFSEKRRKNALPDRRPCVPMKEPKCWKRMSKLLIETCEHCCSPFIHKSGRGDPWCWDAEWTYERCCNTDFQDLVCKMERKGEEGGCVDCKKSVSYVCLTPPEKNLQDSQDDYNRNVDKFNQLQQDAQRLRNEIIAAQADLQEKDVLYRHNQSTYGKAHQIWEAALLNSSRMSSEARLKQMNLSYNLSAQAYAAAAAALMDAREAEERARESLNHAKANETEAEAALGRNESAHAAAKAGVVKAQDNLDAAQRQLDTADIAYEQAQQEAIRLALSESAQLGHSEIANRSRDKVYAATAPNLSARIGDERAASAAIEVAKKARLDAAESVEIARNVSEAAQAMEKDAKDIVDTAERNQTGKTQAVEASIKDEEGLERDKVKREREVEALGRLQNTINSALVALVPASSSEAMLCLISRTPANASARPSLLSSGGNKSVEAPSTVVAVEVKTCSPSDVVEDANEFCQSWAEEGMCIDNAQYMKKACPKSCQGKPGFPTIAPACINTDRVDLAAVKELIAPENFSRIVAELTSGELADGYDGTEVTTPEVASDASNETKAAVAQAIADLQMAREGEKAAVASLISAESNVTLAQRWVAEAAAAYEVAQRSQQVAIMNEVEEQKIVSIWDFFEKSNASANVMAARELDERRDELRRLKTAVEEAVKLVQGLEKARKLAEDRATQKHNTAKRASKRLDVLGKHIEELNMSMAENLTTVAADWLQAQAAEEAEIQRDQNSVFGWGRTILRKAKKVVVDLIASIEAFLDKYVIDMTDKENVVELIRAMEDHKSAKRDLEEAQMSAKNATVQAGAAANSVKKSEAARDKSIAAVNHTESVVQDAELAWNATKHALREASNGLGSARAKLKEAQDLVARRETELKQAATASNKSISDLEERRSDVVKRQEELEVARSGVTQAVYGVELSESSLEAAIADATLSWQERLQRKCKADIHDFNVYLLHQPLFALLRAAVTGRNRSLSLAALRHNSAIAARKTAEASLEVAKAATASAQEAHLVCQQRVNRTLQDLQSNATALAKREEDVLAADKIWRDAQVAVEEVMRLRRRADENATHEAQAHRTSVHVYEAAMRNVGVKAAELKTAERRLQTHTEELGTAQIVEAAKDNAVIAAKTWLAEFRAYLMIPEKQQTLDAAIETAKQKLAIEEKAAAYRIWRLKDVHTHEKNVALVNRQNLLQEKDASKAETKKNYEESEEILKAAQTKLEELVKSEQETSKSIGDTHEELGKLLKVHEDAKEAYAKQDPKDRERSFATKLEGSGPDPNGVDLR